MEYGPPLPPPAPPVKDRIKGRSYLVKGNVRYWDGKGLRDKMAGIEHMWRHIVKKIRIKEKHIEKQIRIKLKNIKEYGKKNKDKRKAYREANKDKIKAYKKEYRKKNKDKRKAYIEVNKDKIKEYSKEWREKNKDKRKAYATAYKPRANKLAKERYNKDEIFRERKKSRAARYRSHSGYLEKRRAYFKGYAPRRNKLRREKYKTDEIYKMVASQRGRIRHGLKAKNAKKNSKTMEYVGCSGKEFKDHIEKQFLPGMAWENHGTDEDKWHVDHRRPCASFTFETEEEKHMCFHYTNCQPMWQRENLAKQ